MTFDLTGGVTSRVEDLRMIECPHCGASTAVQESWQEQDWLYSVVRCYVCGYDNTTSRPARFSYY